MKRITRMVSSLALIAGVTATSLDAATVSETFVSPLIVDNNSGTYSFLVTENQTISDINISIDFTKCDDPLTSSECSADGFSFNRETVFKLISPLMTVVDLVLQDTYGGQTPGARATVTFDDQAAVAIGGNVLRTWRYRPVGSLASLIGENSAGVWSIFYADTVSADPLAFNGYALEINMPSTSGPSEVPLPASLPLLMFSIGAIGFLRRYRH